MEDWRPGFRRALVRAIVRGGSPHDTQERGYWGSSMPKDWERVSRRVSQALASDTIDYAATGEPKDVEWDEFQGTFEPSRTIRGLDLVIVLKGGERYPYRYRGTIGELIMAVVRGDDE